MSPPYTAPSGPVSTLARELGELHPADLVAAGLALSDGSARAWLDRLVGDGLLIYQGGAYRLITAELEMAL